MIEQLNRATKQLIQYGHSAPLRTLQLPAERRRLCAARLPAAAPPLRPPPASRWSARGSRRWESSCGYSPADSDGRSDRTCGPPSCASGSPAPSASASATRCSPEATAARVAGAPEMGCAAFAVKATKSEHAAGPIINGSTAPGEMHPVVNPADRGDFVGQARDARSRDRPGLRCVRGCAALVERAGRRGARRPPRDGGEPPGECARGIL